jgi:1-acyl-sn-glycerol-3-phosphate acyltransferase
LSFSHSLIVTSLKAITSLICRIDAAELKQVPWTGPLIIYTNHVNILEIPIIYTRLQPRKVHGMLLAERWNVPFLRWMLDVTETIPLHRDEADIDAIHIGLEVLARGEIIIISPEGTRSHDGKLQPAHPGVVLLALHSHAPLLPVAYFGAEIWRANLSHFKRTDFHLRVGKLFHLSVGDNKVTKELRGRMMDEMMYQLALLLPPEYRGCYANPASIANHYLSFDQ